MNIQPISFLNFSGVQKINTQKVTKYVTNPLAKDTFTKSADGDLNATMWTLKNIKTDKNKPKLNDYYLEVIKSALTETPEKADAVESLAKNPKINGEFVYMLAMQPLDKLNELKFYSEVKNKNGESKYDGKSMMNFNDKANAADLAKVRPLTKTNLSAKNITNLSQIKDLPDANKLADKILEMEEINGEKLDEINVLKDNYKLGETIIKAMNIDKSTYSRAYDKNFKLLYDEKTKENETTFVKVTQDFRNNTLSEIKARVDKSVGRPVVTHEKRTINDNVGNLIRTEYFSPSDIKGVLNVKHVDKDGKETVLSSGKIDSKTNITTIKKNMTSLDGTKTEYLYENDPQGNRISDYVIKDKNGKVLLKNSESFEVVSPNKFISAKNDERYEINVSETGINVQDLKNKDRKASFKVGKEIQGNQKMIMNTLKQFPGDELIKLSQTVDTLSSIDDSLDSYYSGPTKTIYTGDSAFLLLHELGHAVDYKDTSSLGSEQFKESLKNSITMNSDVNKAYKEEKEAFMKAFPSAQRHHIDYFMNVENHVADETGAIGETIAETNALMNSPKFHEALSYRSQYLQQYFPRTLVKIAEKLG